MRERVEGGIQIDRKDWADSFYLKERKKTERKKERKQFLCM